MSETIVISDIHGQMAVFEELDKLILKYPHAHVVFGGDYIDGHKHGHQVIERIYAYKESWPTQVTVLKGNHESLMLDYVDNPYDGLWFDNGGKATLKQWIKDKYGRAASVSKMHNDLKNDPYVDFVRQMKPMYESGNIVVVHAGVDWALADPIHDTPESDKLWIREDYFYSDSENQIFHHNSTGKTIVSGHTPTVFVTGNFDDGQKPIVSENGFDCPVRTVQYEGEQPRYFIDGGNHAGDARIGNIIVLNKEGFIIDKIQK